MKHADPGHSSLTPRVGRLLAAVMMLTAAPIFADEKEGTLSGQVVYVPIYSEIRHGNLNPAGAPNTLLMSVLVSVRNTDATQSIRIVRAPYFDTSGKLIRQFVGAPITVGPFGTHEMFVELNESAGGSGANFAVEWDAPKPVSPPIIEALHARIQAGYSVTFISRGKAISSR